jgi:enoyl-CoA hydratase/carnithine racemase
MAVVLDKRPNGVAWVTINRPEVLNALDFAAKERLAAIWQEVAGDAQVRVVVLTGAGERAFCAGSDIKEIDRAGHMVSTDTLLRAIPGVGIPLFKPVIAALHGHCVGMGMTLALHCDLRLAATNTVMALPEVRHGMISAMSAIRLPQVVAGAFAMDMLLTAREVLAEEARLVGLVNAVVGDVQAEAESWASRIAGHSPVAIEATKRLALFPRRSVLPSEWAEIEAVRAWVEEKDDYRKAAAAFASADGR